MVFLNRHCLDLNYLRGRWLCSLLRQTFGSKSYRVRLRNHGRMLVTGRDASQNRPTN